MDLDAFEAEVERRSDAWRELGASWEFTHGPDRDNAAAWVRIDSADAAGELIVWASGEAEMSWMRAPFPDGDSGQKHYDLAGTRQLQECLHDFERELGFRA